MVCQVGRAIVLIDDEDIIVHEYEAVTCLKYACIVLTDNKANDRAQKAVLNEALQLIETSADGAPGYGTNKVNASSVQLRRNIRNLRAEGKEGADF
jgi:hypothetical protein